MKNDFYILSKSLLSFEDKTGFPSIHLLPWYPFKKKVCWIIQVKKKKQRKRICECLFELFMRVELEPLDVSGKTFCGTFFHTLSDILADFFLPTQSKISILRRRGCSGGWMLTKTWMAEPNDGWNQKQIYSNGIDVAVVLVAPHVEKKSKCQDETASLQKYCFHIKKRAFFFFPTLTHLNKSLWKNEFAQLGESRDGNTRIWILTEWGCGTGVGWTTDLKFENKKAKQNSLVTKSECKFQTSYHIFHCGKRVYILSNIFSTFCNAFVNESSCLKNLHFSMSVSNNCTIFGGMIRERGHSMINQLRKAT